MSDKEKIVEFIKAYVNADKNFRHKKQYNFNLLDEVHANENAHTRILLKLLSFKHDGTKPFLLEFVKAINELLPDNVSQIPEKKDYEISNQFSYMDGFIYKQNECCIIIENKIHWAKDQYEQIKRYINSSSNVVCNDKEKIYFVYLTSDGNKKPSTESFTDEAKKILGYTDEENPGRFIQMNYRDHILPFLNNVLEMASFSKENILKTAVVQYINHLEGCFGLRKSEEEYKNAMMKKLSEELLKIPGWKDLSEEGKLKKISGMQSEISNIMELLKEQECPNTREFMAKRIEKYFKDKKYLICKNVSVQSNEKTGYWGVKFVLQVLGEKYLIQPSSGFHQTNASRIPFCKADESKISNNDIIDYLTNQGFGLEGNYYVKNTQIDFKVVIEIIESLLAALEKLNQSAQKS